jgi:hypothetical protein
VIAYSDGSHVNVPSLFLCITAVNIPIRIATLFSPVFSIQSAT